MLFILLLNKIRQNGMHRLQVAFKLRETLSFFIKRHRFPLADFIFWELFSIKISFFFLYVKQYVYGIGFRDFFELILLIEIFCSFKSVVLQLSA